MQYKDNMILQIWIFLSNKLNILCPMRRHVAAEQKSGHLSITNVTPCHSKTDLDCRVSQLWCRFGAFFRYTEYKIIIILCLGQFNSVMSNLKPKRGDRPFLFWWVGVCGYPTLDILLTIENKYLCIVNINIKSM